MSADVIDYFRAVNGVEIGDDLIEFWGLEKVIPVEQVLNHRVAQDPREPEDAKYFIFADYLMNSHLYAFSASPHPSRLPVYAIVDAEPVLVSDSFAEFVSLYRSKRLLHHTNELFKARWAWG